MTDKRIPMAVKVARRHIRAWTTLDWDTTRGLLSPNIHAQVSTANPAKQTAELSGIESYMRPKIMAARLIEPGSVEEIAAVGDERNAVVVVRFQIGLGANGTMVEMVRSCLYRIDDMGKIAEERDAYYIAGS